MQPLTWDHTFRLSTFSGGRGRARDLCWGGPGLDSRCGRPLSTGWVGVSIIWPAETEVIVSQLCLMCGSTLNCQTRYSLVVDEDVKKRNNQNYVQRFTFFFSGQFGRHHARFHNNWNLSIPLRLPILTSIGFCLDKVQTQLLLILSVLLIFRNFLKHQLINTSTPLVHNYVWSIIIYFYLLAAI